MQLFVLQRENKINTSETFTKPTTFWFRLDSDGAHKVHTVAEVYTADSKSYL